MTLPSTINGGSGPAPRSRSRRPDSSTPSPGTARRRRYSATWWQEVERLGGRSTGRPQPAAPARPPPHGPLGPLRPPTSKVHRRRRFFVVLGGLVASLAAAVVRRFCCWVASSRSRPTKGVTVTAGRGEVTIQWKSGSGKTDHSSSTADGHPVGARRGHHHLHGQGDRYGPTRSRPGGEPGRPHVSNHRADPDHGAD